MTAIQQPASPLARWAMTTIHAVRHLNNELLGAGDAIARANRFPQPGPHADQAQARQAHPASAGHVLAGV